MSHHWLPDNHAVQTLHVGYKSHPLSDIWSHAVHLWKMSSCLLHFHLYPLLSDKLHPVLHRLLHLILWSQQLSAGSSLRILMLLSVHPAPDKKHQISVLHPKIRIHLVLSVLLHNSFQVEDPVYMLPDLFHQKSFPVKEYLLWRSLFHLSSECLLHCKYRTLLRLLYCLSQHPVFRP